MGFQTWGWGSRHGDWVPVRDGVPDMGIGLQTWGWGSQHGDGVPDMGMGFQTRKNPNVLYRWRRPVVMIFDRVLLGKGHGDVVPDMRKGFQTRSGVPDMEMGFWTWVWG